MVSPHVWSVVPPGVSNVSLAVRHPGRVIRDIAARLACLHREIEGQDHAPRAAFEVAAVFEHELIVKNIAID